MRVFVCTSLTSVPKEVPTFVIDHTHCGRIQLQSPLNEKFSFHNWPVYG